MHVELYSWHPPQLQSLPATNDNSERYIRLLEEVTAPERPEVDFNCERLVDEATGLIGVHVEWSYSDENSRVREAIRNYRFSLQFKGMLPSGGMDIVVGGNIDLNPMLSQKVSDAYDISLRQLLHVHTYLLCRMALAQMMTQNSFVLMEHTVSPSHLR